MSDQSPRPLRHAGIDVHRAVGGTGTWRRLAVAFYARVDRDHRIRPLFPGTTLRCAVEELTAFLAQLFGGPSADTQFRWWLSLKESHQRFKIGPVERAAWMENMVKALDDVSIHEPMRGALRDFFDFSSTHVINQGGLDPAAPFLPQHAGDTVRQEMARCWEGQRILDEAVAAVRAGDADRAVTLAQSPALLVRFDRDRSVLAGLLGLMMGSRNPALQAYVQTKIEGDPALVSERYAGRTLLHEASAKGSLPFVKLLLRVGADVNAEDGGGHAPLYCLANEYGGSDGGDIVRALAQGGANVNANDGAKRCTALHMAARRGHVGIATALLDCGAAIDARDSLGDTPLRRSVNCDKIHVAGLLVQRSADVHSVGSKGLTPLLAARSPAMKQLLSTCGDLAPGGRVVAGPRTRESKKRNRTSRP